MKPRPSAKSPPRKGLFFILSLCVSLCVAAFQWVCRRSDKITATEYAKAHGLDVRAVLAAAAESRLDPQAYTQGPDLPESSGERGDTVLVSRHSIIRPRFNAHAKR